MSSFTVYPAIELRAGMALKYENAGMGTRASRADAVSYARELEAQGAQVIHLFNLDGAFSVAEFEHGGSVLAGAQRNLEVLMLMAKQVKVPLQFGGGVRDLPGIMKLIELGAKRVVLGEAAMSDPALVKAALAFNADALVCSINAREGIPVGQQWVPDNMKLRADELAVHMKAAGVKHLIYQDAAAEAAGQGPALAHAARVAQSGLGVVVAGGVSSLAHIRQCAATAGIGGVLVGKALAQDKFTLEQALETAAAGLSERR